MVAKASERRGREAALALARVEELELDGQGHRGGDGEEVKAKQMDFRFAESCGAVPGTSNIAPAPL